MPNFLWVVKTAESKSLSHSKDEERIEILKHAQTRSRLPRASRSKPIENTNANGDDDLQHLLHGIDLKLQQDKIHHSPTFTSEWTKEEHRGLYVFERMAIYKIVTLQRDLSFWTVVVPYLAYNYAAFRHIVVAISATFEIVAHGASDETNIFALEQCNKATKALRSWDDITCPQIMASCILIAAYNLLRSDSDQADKTIESGLRVADTQRLTSSAQRNSELHGLTIMLIQLGRQFGFKLWAPDISFQFETVQAGQVSLIIDFESIQGPFINAEQVLEVFKTLLVSLVAKIMRNLTRGTYIPSQCRLAQAAQNEFQRAFFYCDQLYQTLPLEHRQKRIELRQLSIGLHLAYVHMATKILRPDELSYDSQTQRFACMLRFAEEVLAGRHDGIPTIYIDRIVNGSIFTIAICCREPKMRRQAIKILQDQLSSENGLKNYLLGTVAEAIAKIEEADQAITTCHDIPAERRVHLVGMTCCTSTRMIGVQYIAATAPDKSNPMEIRLPCPPAIQHRSAQEIHETLVGIQSVYTMYMRADRSQAPRGYIRPMLYHGDPVPVLWQSADAQ